MSTHNEGIIVSGGTFHSDATAVGRGAVVNTHADDALADLRTRIEQLQADLARLTETLADDADLAGAIDPAGATEAAAAAAAELNQPKPRKVVLTSLLSTVLGAVGGVSSLVNQVEGLAHAVQTVL